MSFHFPKSSIAFFAILGAALVTGCGIDDSWSNISAPAKIDDGSDASVIDVGEIAGRLDQPTGTVDASSALPVANAFASASTSSLNGTRSFAGQNLSVSQTCESTGNMSATGTVGETGGEVAVVYSNCCVADCCYDGTADVVYVPAGDQEYTYWADYKIEYTCNGEDFSAVYAACTQPDGTVTYSVVVDGATYTVTGSYANGSGELTITGANGIWSCAYANDSGSCTGAEGEFSFHT